MAFSAEPLILLVGTKTPLRVATLSSLYSQKSISAVPWNENNYYQDASACAGCHSKKWSFVRAGADTHILYMSAVIKVLQNAIYLVILKAVLSLCLMLVHAPLLPVKPICLCFTQSKQASA